MAFKELDEFLAPEPLVLPIRGKEYTFPGEISARTWLRVQSIGGQVQRAIQAQAAGEDFDPDVTAISDIDQDELLVELCGETLQTMLDDGLTSVEFKAVLATLMAYHMSDRDAAEAVWNAQGEASGPNRATRRAKSPAKSTPSRASRAGSTAPKAGAGTARRGVTSSSTGS